MGAAAGRAAASAAKKAVIPKPSIPVKISTGEINIGNKQQQEN
jgi:hypothetical protein